MAKGVLERGGTEDDWTKALVTHLGEQAAGRQSKDGKYDLAAERARLAARQAEKLEIETARLRADLMPIQAVVSAFSYQHSTMRNRLLAVPSLFKAQRPEISTAAFTALKALITEILEELSHVRFPRDLDEQTRRYFSDLHAAAKHERNGVGG